MNEQCSEFELVSLDFYGDKFAENCKVTETARGSRFAGECPRCSTAMTFDWVHTYTRATHSSASGATVQWKDVPVMCTCTKSHQGAPPGELGCGAHWRVEVAVE